MRARREGAQLEAFIGGVVDATIEVGQVGMVAALAEALAAFRACNYERIYLRPGVDRPGHRRQAPPAGPGASTWLGAPGLLPPASAEAAGWPPPGSEAALRAAVAYVAGMTDRYALARAEEWLGWDTAALVISAT